MGRPERGASFLYTQTFPVDMFVHSKRIYTAGPNQFERIFRVGYGFVLDGGAYV